VGERLGVHEQLNGHPSRSFKPIYIGEHNELPEPSVRGKGNYFRPDASATCPPETGGDARSGSGPKKGTDKAQWALLAMRQRW